MEKFMKFKRDIRGRDYFYDYRGNVIIVNQTDFDKPSSNKVNVRVTIEKAPETTEANDITINTDVPPHTKTKKKDKDHKRHQNQSPTDSPASSDNLFYKEIKLSQPSMDTSTVKVSPGVTLHAVERKKEIATGSIVTSLRPARKKLLQPHQTLQPQQLQPQPQLQSQAQQAQAQPQAHPQPQTQPQQPQPHIQPPLLQKSEMFPAIPHVHAQPILTLSPTTLYGSTQKMWTTEMLADNFNSLLPSIKPKAPSSPKFMS